MIQRPIYMNQLLKFKDKHVIKIITGIRRAGKSTLLKLFKQHLIETGISSIQIIQMNFESMKLRSIRDEVSLYEAIQQQVQEDSKTYILLDEIQVVPHWEKAINSLQVDFDVDIYITGSNAYLLSSELSTLLSGRYVEIPMLPFSFKEIIELPQYTHKDPYGVFQDYLKFGGMPMLSEYDTKTEEDEIYRTLDGIYSTVILKDVIERNKIADVDMLQKLMLFLADNVGNIVSTSSISKGLVANGREKSTTPATRTVDNYLDALTKSFIIYGIKRYDIKGKQFLKTLGKYYLVDLGFRSMLLGYRNIDRGHILENVVYLELLRRGYRVSIGKTGEKEVDFIAETPSDRIYIQVTESMLGEATRQRELAPLYAINDFYQRLVLSMDREFVDSYDGIKVMNIIDWLLT